jgi:hypothetical protein
LDGVNVKFVEFRDVKFVEFRVGMLYFVLWDYFDMFNLWVCEIKYVLCRL